MSNNSVAYHCHIRVEVYNRQHYCQDDNSTRTMLFTPFRWLIATYRRLDEATQFVVYCFRGFGAKPSIRLCLNLYLAQSGFP